MQISRQIKGKPSMLKEEILRKISIISLALLMSGCATSFQGTKQKISVNSTPKNAEVITSHGFGCDATPCSFFVPRNKSFKLQVAKPGFSSKTVKVASILSGVGTAQSAGSVLLGGVIAGGYDVYKGSVWELSTDSVNVKLENMSALLLEEVRLVSNMSLFD